MNITEPPNSLPHFNEKWMKGMNNKFFLSKVSNYIPKSKSKWLECSKINANPQLWMAAENDLPRKSLSLMLKIQERMIEMHTIQGSKEPKRERTQPTSLGQETETHLGPGGLQIPKHWELTTRRAPKQNPCLIFGTKKDTKIWGELYFFRNWSESCSKPCE